MKLSKMSAAAVFSTVVFGAGAVTAWSGTIGTQSVTPAIATVASNNSIRVADTERSWLEPSAANAKTEVTKNCDPGRVYSQHDVIGDPDSCWQHGNSITLGIAP